MIESMRRIRANTLKTLLTVAFFFCFMGSSFADEINIPFAINVKAFKKEVKAHGLDLYDKEKSHGFVQNKVSMFTVFTYKQATTEQLEIIKNATWKSLRK